MWDGVGVESKIECVGEVCVTEWPNCLRCLMLMPSGPVELLFLLFRMAADISDVVSINAVLGSYELVCQSSYLFCLKCVGPC